MKTHTQTFKENLTTLGKEINAKVAYTIDGVETELDGDTLSSVEPHFDGNLLKSVMKQVDIVSDVDIPLNTEINVQFGMKYDDEEFEYIDYGNYIVFSSEKQEDTNNYKIIAYDKMLYAMKDYEPLFDTNLFVSSNAQIGVAWNNDENSARAVCYVECKPNTTYYVSFSSLVGIDGIYWFEKAQKEDATTTLGATQVTQARSFTTKATSNYIGIQFNKTNISQEDINNIGVVITESNQLVNTYPTTINDYINKLCTKINLEFANNNEVFCNYNKQITQELYKDLGYTYRDVLDQLAQVTASTICINKDDQLEIRYLNESVNDSEEVEGTDLTLSNSESAKISGVVVEGNTSQVQYTGKNLFCIAPQTLNGVTLSYDNNGAVVLNGKSTAGFTQFKQTVSYSGTYTLSVKNAVANENVYVRTRTSSNVLAHDIRLNNTNDKKTTANASVGFFDITIAAQNIQFTNFKIYVQFESGSSATSFEPYVGGNSSPNPDYPQEVKVVSGRQEVSLTGKNLFSYPYSDTTKTTNGITFTDNGDGSITINGTATAQAIFYLKNNSWSFDSSSILPTGTYTFNSLGQNPDIYLYLNLYKSDNTNQTYYTYTTNTTFNVSTTQSLNMPRIVIPSGKTINNEIVYPQLEKGSSATDFEEYKNKSYEINLGKNLIDTSSLLYGTISQSDGTTISTSSDVLYTPNYIEVNENNSYTFSCVPTGIAVRGFYYNKNKTYISTAVISHSTRNYQTFTIPSGIKYCRFQFNKSYNTEFMLEKGDTPTSYSPYFDPIFLGEIGNYKDLIFKSEGINLLPISSLPTQTKNGITFTNNGDGTYTFNGTASGYTAFSLFQDLTFNGNYTYVLKNTATSGFNLYLQNSSGAGITDTATHKTLNNNVGRMIIGINSGVVLNNVVINPYVYSGDYNESILYEPYGSKGKWLLHKEIGKVVFEGSNNENWLLRSDVNITGYKCIMNGNYVANSRYSASLVTNVYCNRFIPTAGGYEAKPLLRIINTNGYGETFMIPETIATSGAEFKNWLTNNNVIIYYPLLTSTTTEITNDNYPELLSQLKALDKAKTYEGTTNITSSFPIKFSYATDYETINEDYIKNTRASFGEKYGPINSIVLSRSADSDNIYIQDEESIEANGLCELKISDNQIMNSDNRNEYLDDLISYLGGIEYYTNDYESIGITYLDLCDKYKVQIGDTKYDCIMFNDDVSIRDGLNEVIYTNKPEETQTDYKKATTTDKLKRQTSLIVDKQNERIEAIVGDVESDFSSIRIDINGIKSEVQGYDTIINEQGEEIQQLRSSFTEQTPTMISDWFDTNLKPIVDDLQNTASGNDEEIRKIKAYVRRGVISDPQSPYYNQAYIELGDETNQTTLRILQNRIQFLTNGQETAFISNNQLYINESTILTKEKVGHWVTTEDEDGLLNTYWED